ncbi:MAG: GAF domain-containing protein, partial [Alphaproteobacteria bacterium]|nr:GAF domain-containing protein [Alphaproteobacteria bacterium]
MGEQDDLNIDVSPGLAANQRRWERQDYKSALTLLLDDGRNYPGHTRDVSLGGVYIIPDTPGNLPECGMFGHVRFASDHDSLVFPCEVVRVAGGGIGVNFHDKQASFGMFITHDMMLDLLTSINNSFAASMDMGETLQISVDHIKNYLQCEAASLFLLENNDNVLVCRACAGPVDITGMRLRPDEGIVGRVTQGSEAIIAHDVRGDSRFAEKVDAMTGFKTESLLCAPLVIRGRVLGALEVLNKRGSGLFVGHDRVVLTALASATALAIVNARQAALHVNDEANRRA